jgi:septum formation protein
VPFTVVTPDVDELAEGDPHELVRENAARKARAVPGDRVLGVDTAVVLDGRPLGKPRDAGEARSFLTALSGRGHEVLSGMMLREDGEEREVVAATAVRFRTLEPRDLDWYLASEEWRERAGGYAIQRRGAALVEEIRGDYWNVVGLPVAALLGLCPGLLHRSAG